MISLPPSNPAPFDFDGAAPAAVLFHGFTGTPYEVRPLGEALAAAGRRAVGPVLAGHGYTPADLGVTTADQILDRARRDLDAVPGARAICGFSMGALVAGLLAAEQPERVPALVLMAPAARLAPWAEAGLRAIRAGLWRALPTLPKLVQGGDCGDPYGRRRNPSLRVHPTRALLALDDLARRFRQVAPRLRMPTLVLHGVRDRTIPVRVGDEVITALGAEVIEHARLPRSRHLLLLDVERDQVIARVQGFLERYAATA